MKILKYFLFFVSIFFCYNVYAQDVDVTSNCYGTTGYSGMYSGDEVQYQTYSNYNFGTTYQYQLSNFETELRYSLLANTDYIITFNTNNSNDFRNNFRTYNVYDLNNNNNNLVTGFTFVSQKKVQISFKTTTATNNVKIQMGGANVYDNITGEVNWNIKNAILSIPDTPPSGTSNQDVIDNATDNTNNIINNNNQNTQDIINNNNQNSQDIINNQNSLFGLRCPNLIDIPDLSLNKDNNRTYDYLLPNVLSSGTYTLSYKYNSNGNPSTHIQILLQGTAGTLVDLTLTSLGKNTFTVNNSFNRFYILITNDSPSGSSATISDFILVPSSSSFPYCKYGTTLSKIDSLQESQTQNTQDIINNQNQNTNTTIESQKVCSIIDKNSIKTNGFLSSEGVVNSSQLNGITDYKKTLNSSLKLLKKRTASNFLCFYDENKTLISCINTTNLNENSNITFPNGTSYFRATIRIDEDKPQFEYCSSGNQAISESINDLNDSITDSNVGSDTGTGFFDNFTSQDFGLSQIITIPLNTIQSLTSKTCVPLQVPIPFTNSNVTLPCMTEIYQTKFSGIYNLWKIVSFGIIAYLISIDIFHIVKGFKDPESDKVEVLDL